MNELLDDEKPVKKKQSARDIELGVIKNTMSTEAGRAMLWRFVSKAGTFNNNFVADPYVHAQNAGARSHGLWLDRELREASLDFYLQMLKENS